MTEPAAPAPLGALQSLAPARLRAALADFASLVSGSLGRLGFSLVYFLVLANALPVADYGVMAAASAIGVVLSRVCGLGFSSPLYRISTVKPQLAGTYLAGYFLFAVLSAPLVVLGGWLAHRMLFANDIGALTFTLILVAEIVFWRSSEILMITCNGLGRFGRAAALTIAGTALRMVAALMFVWLAPEQDLQHWAWFYLGANAAAFACSAVFAWPPGRFRLVPKLYGRRMKDALSVAGGEVTFYAQMELDKVLMLSLAGGEAAGLYAIIMRLVDLTAIPIRAFNTLLVQRIMRAPDMMSGWLRRAGTEAGIALVSIGALAFVTLLLMWKPALLGQSVAIAAPALVFALLIPALRNLTEYHSELLYARGQTLWRVGLLVLLGILKAGTMAAFLSGGAEPKALFTVMTGIFALLYAVSAVSVYSLLRAPAARF